MTDDQVTALLERMDRLITLMEQNERDRELSTWRHGDGSPLTRKETEILGLPFEGPADDA